MNENNVNMHTFDKCMDEDVGSYTNLRTYAYPNNTSATSPFRRLDNMKIFLISMVVVGHTGFGFTDQGAFIAQNGPGGLNGSAMAYPNWFAPVGVAGAVLLQPILVPNFFLISGLCPSCCCPVWMSLAEYFAPRSRILLSYTHTHRHMHAHTQDTLLRGVSPKKEWENSSVVASNASFQPGYCSTWPSTH